MRMGLLPVSLSMGTVVHFFHGYNLAGATIPVTSIDSDVIAVFRQGPSCDGATQSSANCYSRRTTRRTHWQFKRLRACESHISRDSLGLGGIVRALLSLRSTIDSFCVLERRTCQLSPWLDTKICKVANAFAVREPRHRPGTGLPDQGGGWGKNALVLAVAS